MHLEKALEHKEQVVQNLKGEVSELHMQIISLKQSIEGYQKCLDEFKIWGTDDCPECERYSDGSSENRITLFYKPSEHGIHEEKYIY